MRQEKLFIGVVAHREGLELAWLYKGNTSYLPAKHFANTRQGYEEAIKFFFSEYDVKTPEVIFCFENITHHVLPFTSFLDEHLLGYCQGSPLSKTRAQALKLSKNFSAIARVLARFVFLHREELQPLVLPSIALLELRSLLNYREQLDKHKLAIQLSAFHSVEERSAQSNAFINHSCHDLIDVLETRIEQVDSRLNKVIEREDQLRQALELATSVRGISPEVAAHMIVATNCFTRFGNWRKFASYSGTAPKAVVERNINYTTTEQPRKPVFDTTLRGLLTTSARMAIERDAELRKFYERKLQKGKPEGAALNAIRNKLISRVFATVKRGTPYVAMSA